MLRMAMIGVDENDNKTEPEDASRDIVDNFNEDTCEVCLYDVENKAESSNATHARDDDQIHAHKYFW